MPKLNWNTDRILGISAMLVSLITLFIFIYQTNLMQDQNRLSILPYLSLNTSNNAEIFAFELNLANHGMGPAIIESITILYKDKQYKLEEYDNDLFTLLQSLVPQLGRIQNLSSSSLNKGMAIPSNTVYNIFMVKSDQNDYQLLVQSIEQLIQEGLDYEVIYKSLLQERWRIHENSEGPEKL